ncbi:MAG: hypothetical protein ABI889_04675 [Gemmatimonadota bacterium]
MMRADWHDEDRRGNERAENGSQAEAIVRSLEHYGVDVTGEESASELSIMKGAVDAFRRAAEVLAGQTTLGARDDLCRQVVPPRAADETPRQYAERVNRMTERFRVLAEGSRKRPR